MSSNGQASAEENAGFTHAGPGGDPGRAEAGPYGAPEARSTRGDQRPSYVLAANIRCYRILRGMTQYQLAARMAVLGHGWSRSSVSATEGSGRNVSIDELFGLAIIFGVTVGRLARPAGPDRSRNVGLDVGLGRVGNSGPLPTQLGRLFAASRAVIRLDDDDQSVIDIDMASEEAKALAEESHQRRGTPFSF